MIVGDISPLLLVSMGSCPSDSWGWTHGTDPRNARWNCCAPTPPVPTMEAVWKVIANARTVWVGRMGPMGPWVGQTVYLVNIDLLSLVGHKAHLLYPEI